MTVVSEPPIIKVFITLESAWIKGNSCTKTFDIDTILEKCLSSSKEIGPIYPKNQSVFEN